MNVSYTFYTDAYGGRMSAEDFARMSVKASAYLVQVTLGRCINPIGGEQVAQAVKMAFCEVADAMLTNESGGDIVSESNDGVSVSYANRAKTDAQRLSDAAALHLACTGLLYRGCCFRC